jgi:hypothetical protein
MPWQVEAVDGQRQTALHRAAAGRCGFLDGDPAAAAAVTELLLQRGARVDARDCDGETPLHCASRYWCLASMRLLLDHGAEVDACDGQGRTPLMAMFGGAQLEEFAECPAAEGVELLAGRGADANAVDEAGRSPLMHACGLPDTDEDTVCALVDAGARVGRDNGPLLIDEVLAASARANEPPSLGAIYALIDAGAGASLSNVRALAEAAEGFVDEALMGAVPGVLAAAERALDEDEGARVAARLAAAVEADRRDVASGLRALITGAAAEARRLEAARAALEEERRAAAAEREALAQERLAATERAEPRRQGSPSGPGPRRLPSRPGVARPLEAPNGSGGGEAKPPTKRARRG